MTTITKDQLLQKAQTILPWLVDVRRDFHQHPELGMEEYRTRDKIIDYLTEMGIPYERDIAGTGVVGIIKGAKEGKTVALRGDIDALPIVEQNDVPYKSRNEGKMHACGHDAHTTVVLGAARLLQEYKGRLHGNVKLFFQPAEETVGGAKPMIEQGAMDNPKVDAVFGLHVDTSIPVGQVAVKYGQMNASSDTIYVTIKGKNAHGAYPSTGIDAIVVAAHVITTLQTIVSRNVDPRDSAVITLGVINGGTQSNIIAKEVQLIGTVRTLTPEVRANVLQRIEEVVAYTTKSLGADYAFELGADGYPALINTDEIVDIVKETGQLLLGEENVQEIELASLGAEDFSYFAAAAPSAFFRLGTGNKEKGIVHGAHTGRFDIDEDSLAVGVAMQVQNVLSFLGK